MDNNMVMVRSESDYTLVVNVPDIPLHRTWSKRGAKYPIDRKQLLMAYYDPAVEALFREGMLTTDDKDFLREVGLIEEDGAENVTPLTATMMNRLIKIMPVAEVKKELPKLSQTQLMELGEYAITHYTDLQNDRVDILSKATGKNLMNAIKNYKDAQEG